MQKALLMRFNNGSTDPVIAHIREEQSSVLFKESLASDDAPSLIESYTKKISRIHYSWLLDPIQKLPKEIVRVCLLSLTDSQRKGLSELMHIPYRQVELHPKIREYFSHLLYQKLTKEEPLPASFLISKALLPLTHFSKNELVELIDYLGLYELSHELRSIVDKEKLKLISNSFSREKLAFLKNIQHLKKPVEKPLELQRWDGDAKKLQKVLHRRGNVRLSKAISGEHPDLIWHLSHVLDIVRGELLAKEYSKEAIPHITPLLCVEVIHVINFMRKINRIKSE